MNQSSNKLHSVKEVPSTYKAQFGEDLDFYEMLKHVDYVMRQAGVPRKQYLLKGEVKDFELELPCGVEVIHYVCDSRPLAWWVGFWGTNTNFLINYRVDQSGNLGLYNPDATDHDVINEDGTAVYEINKNVFQKPVGPMIDFQNDNNCCLSFNHKEKKVDILYSAKQLDPEGYPMVSDKTLHAIAAYCYMILIRKRFFMKQATGDMFAVAKNAYEIAVSQARTPDSLGDNEMDDVLDVMTNNNRKKFNEQFRGG